MSSLPEKGEKLNIVLADDEMHARMIINAYLVSYNVRISEARNGKEAIEAIKKNPVVDLMIIDYSMPVMDGRELLEWLHKSSKFSKIPVIVYTAGGFSLQQEEYFKRSAEGYLEKSNLGEDLIPTIKEILGDKFKKN
ncbi:MAG: response regulator [Elusimicrobia bacterium]|jgi:CheY-like chemotaxis protein|nr:response regulator [Elusimicrobiota bacterium]